MPVQIPDLISQAGSGWRDLLLECHSELAALAPDYEANEVGAEPGELILRCQPDPALHIKNIYGFFKVIEKYKARSKSVCDECGDSGRPREDANWRVLCSSCSDLIHTQTR